MKFYRQWAAGALAAAMIFTLAGCGGKTEEGEGQPLSAAVSGVAVQIAAVTAESIATDHQVSGRVAAEDEATIMVAVSARCTKTYVDAGDRVKEGDILCTLDLGSTLSQYNAARINYDSAVQSYNDQRNLFDQQLAVARDQVKVYEQQIVVTQQQITAAEENITASEQTIAAQEQNIPAAEQIISASEQTVTASEGQIPVLEQQISVLEQQTPITEQQIAMAEENITVAEQQAAQVERQSEQAQKAFNDAKELLAIGAASQAEVDQAEIAANQAKTAVTQAQMGVSQARSNLDQAKLGLEQADLQLNQLKAQLEQTKAQLTSSRAQINQSKAQLTSSRAQIDQSKAQLTSSRAQIDQSKFQLTQLELQRDNAKVSVTQLENTRASTLAQLEAGIENARSSVQQLGSVLEDVDENGNVIAPMDGILVTFNALENSYIASTMPVAVIDGEGQMKITTSVSEALVPKLASGDNVDVYVNALDQSFATRIRSVERAASAQNSLYTVTLSVPSDVDGLLAGMFADVTFHTDRVDNAVVIPSEAILTSGSGQYVFTVAGGVAHYVEITTGLTGAGVTEVLTGLHGGEALITVGQSYVKDGDPVRVVGGSA